MRYYVSVMHLNNPATGNVILVEVSLSKRGKHEERFLLVENN